MAEVQLSTRAASVKTAYEANADTNAYTDAEKTKLAGVAPGATVNSTDAQLRDRSTHTGDQPASSISDFAEALHNILSTMLVEGSNVSITFDNEINKVTFSIEGIGTGDVTKVGTPVQGRVAVWSGDGTLDHDPEFLYANSTLYVTNLEVDGLPLIAVPKPAGDALAFFDLSEDRPSYITTLVGASIAGTTLSTEVTLNNTATLTNKTLTSPVFNTGVSGSALANAATTGAGVSTTHLLTPAGFSGSILNAVGPQQIWIDASYFVSPTAGGAELTTVDIGGKPFYIAAFDTASEETVFFSFKMPKNWNLGTLTYQVFFAHGATATNFGTAWGLSAVAISNDDPANSAFGTEVVVTDTGGTTDDFYGSPVSGAVTVGGTPAAEDLVVFKLARKVANAGDTLAIDARVRGLALIYTTNAANVS